MNQLQVIATCHITLLTSDGKTVVYEMHPQDCSQFNYDFILATNEYYTVLQKELNKYVFPTSALKMPALIAWSYQDDNNPDELLYSYEDNTSPDSDISGHFHGKFVDVVKHDDNTWSWFYDGERKEAGLATRNEAKQQLINYCAKQKAEKI